jgi:predicted nucleic acid-binding protein
MGSLDLSDLPERALLLLDAPPIIYLLEGHSELMPRFRPLVDAHGRGELRLAVSTLALAEVMVGPLRANDEALAKRHRAVMESWDVVELDADVAESAARLRASLGLKLPDAVQVASALAINADALVTHDRDFSRVKALRVIS